MNIVNQKIFITSIFPLNESVFIHNEYVMVTCRIIKNNGKKIFIIYNKTEG